MDYVLGSVAALVSGNVTPNRPKRLKKALTPTKHQASPNVTPKSELVEDKSIFMSPTLQKKKAIIKKSPKRIFQNPELDVTNDGEDSSLVASPKADKVKKHLKEDLDTDNMASPILLSPKSPKIVNENVTESSKSKTNSHCEDNELASTKMNENSSKKKKKRNSATKLVDGSPSNEINNKENISEPSPAPTPMKKRKRSKSVIDGENNDMNVSTDETNGNEKDNEKSEIKVDNVAADVNAIESQSPKKKKKNKKKNKNQMKDENLSKNEEEEKVQPIPSESNEVESNNKGKKKKQKNKLQTEQSIEEKNASEVKSIEPQNSKKKNKKKKKKLAQQNQNQEAKESNETENLEVNPNAVTNQDTDSEHDSDDEEMESENEEINKKALDTGPAEDSSDEEEVKDNKKATKEQEPAPATEDEIKRTLFVGNVPFSSKCKKEIKKIFSQYGQIETVRIRTVPVKDARVTPKMAVIKKELHPDRTTVNVYVKYADAASVNKALAANNTVLNDHHLRVSRSDTTGAAHDLKCSVFLGNLPFALEDEALRQKFEKCGEIESVRIIRDKKTNAGKGFGYVNFASKDGVELALKLTEEDLTIKNRIIRVKRCTLPTQRKTNPRHQQDRKNVGQFGKGRFAGNQGDGRPEGAHRRIMNKRKNQEGGEGPPNKRQDLNQPHREKKPRREFVGMTAEKKKKHKFNKGQKKKKVLSEILTKK